MSRTCPEALALRRAFRIQEHRRQRRSDGTFTLHAVRFEVPSAYRHLEQVCLRYARWECEHAAGNHRILMNLAGELLAQAAQRELSQIDEKLYLETYTATQTRRGKR